MCITSCSLFQSEFDKRVNHALDYSVMQLKKSAAAIENPLQFARSGNPDGTWRTTDMYGWTSGHFPGCLWYAWEYSKDPSLKAAAIKWTEALEPVKDYTGNHDVGFMIYCSYGNGYRLTHNESYVPVIVKAAESLSTRYTRPVGLIQSWNSNDRWKYPVIIDNMMNLELIFFAAKHGGFSELYLIAEEHALNTMKNHVREDGSTFHVVDYDPETGAVRAKNTAQGYADDSTWSRGQAWGLYGFTMTYRETKNPVFLRTAQKLADFYIEHLPEDYVPYWDFFAPNIPNEKRDTSAGAIAASGLLELSTLVSDKAVSKKYYRTALNILNSLCSPEYLTEGTNSPGILQHAVGSIPHNVEVDVSLIYGDYYFLEALLRYKRGIKN
ncbi:MAG: glycoside hydrolase family 88 protein [Candidatus Latescibacteria bacterium]|nr:glycoside hydrolase family 88 protein [Candidatus Latescibacterota bacterium]